MLRPTLHRLAISLTLCLSAGVLPAAWAAEGHGGDGSEERVSIKPTLRTEAKSEAKSEPRADAKADPKAGAGDKGDVSMTDLRDMIDQKINEVRTRRAAPPVVQVRSRAPAVRKKPASAHPQETIVADNHGTLSKADPMGHEVHWAYGGATGPDSWGRLKPEFSTCMLGRRQSPIDIRDGIPVELDPIQFDYRPTIFRVTDNGHTVQVNVEPGNSITVQGHRYELVQFHFHRPSEERINGRPFDMVAHLVHKDADGKLAVVAVLMEQGKAHPVVQMVWNNIPLEKGLDQQGMAMMDLAGLIPERRQYYTYMGSLTTPPCTEGVLWLVMKQPASMSPEQISVFSRLYPMNARPVQPVSGRLIKEGM